jgi:outer membrane lipoprotein-sorting protein
MSYTAKTRKGPKEAMSVLKNYKKVSGVMIPHKTVTYQDGEKSTEVTRKTVTINADVSDDLFTESGASEE